MEEITYTLAQPRTRPLSKTLAHLALEPPIKRKRKKAELIDLPSGHREEIVNDAISLNERYQIYYYEILTTAERTF